MDVIAAVVVNGRVGQDERPDLLNQVVRLEATLAGDSCLLRFERSRRGFVELCAFERDQAKHAPAQGP